MDANPQNVRQAEESGFRAIYGNALEERPLQLAEVDTRFACVGITQNEEMNLLFVRKALEEHKAPRAYVEIRATASRISPEMVHRAGAGVLFGGPRDVQAWATRFAQGEAELACWEWQPSTDEPLDRERMLHSLESGEMEHLLPMVLERAGRLLPLDDLWEPRRGDRVFFAVHAPMSEGYEERLAGLGWKRLELPQETEAAPVVAA